MTGEWAPSRHVVLDGAVNVRDIGGYRIVGGPEVVRGRLYRGDSLSQLTSSDVERLDRLGLRTVVDFRTPGELLLGGGRAASFMVEMNRGFVADARQREAFGAALRLLCSPGRLPLLYHCTGGKDRAGWMTAIVLTALGVPREVVLRDYLLSNDFHRTGYQKLRFDLVKTGIVADPELLRPVLELSATYLGAAFEEADRQYGSFGRFLAYGLEVSEVMLTGLRRALLGDLVPPEPVPLTPGPHPPPLPPSFTPAYLRRRGPRVQLEVREQREYHRKPDHDAHVAEPVTRRLFPQRVGHPAHRRGDRVEVHRGRGRGETPARRRDHRELLESRVVGQWYHVAGQDHLDHGEQHQERHRLLRRADHGRHEQAEAHRGDREHGDAEDQLDQRDASEKCSLGGELPPGHADQHEQRRLQDADDAQDDQLGDQVRAGRQAGRPFSGQDRAFLDQFPHRAGHAGQARTDHQDQQQGPRVQVGPWRAAQAMLSRHLRDQRAEEDGKQGHEGQVAAVGRDHPHVPPGQRGHLAEGAAPLRRRGGRQFLAVLHLGHLRPLAQDVLGVGGRGGVLPGPVAVRVPLEGLEHLGPAGLAEVGEPFLGRAVVGDPPAGDQDERPVAGVQVVHAVGDDDDRPAVVGQVPHLLHDRLVQARVQARGRLVQEQQ